MVGGGLVLVRRGCWLIQLFGRFECGKTVVSSYLSICQIERLFDDYYLMCISNNCIKTRPIFGWIP